MSKTVTLTDAVSIVYEGVSCAGLPSGAVFGSLYDFFQRLNGAAFSWNNTFRCKVSPHSLYVSLSRLHLGDRVYTVPVLVEVRDADGVRIPGWRLVELYDDFQRERTTRHRALWSERYPRRYEFRDGPAPGGFKRRRHKRKHPRLRSEMISNQIVEEEDVLEAEFKVRAKRASKTLLGAIWSHHGRSRCGNSWKKHRSDQWRS
jgi:hypothetical protein